MGKKKRVPTYEEYVKAVKPLEASMYKREWENLTDKERMYHYKDEKSYARTYLFVIVSFIILIVGGMAGCIIYHIHIDDILNGILLALGFPIFIIAGFFGAGKV